MTRQFLSFGSIPEFHDHSIESTSPIGELTSQERLYARDLNYYPASKDGITLINFYSKNDNEQEVALPNEQIIRLNDITVWLVDQAKAGNLTNNKEECLQQLRAQFTKDIEIVSVGEMVTNSVVFLPSFIDVRLTDKQEVVHAKTWYATGYFGTEYPYRELLVDLPLPKGEIDFLLEHNYLEIENRLSKETPEVVQVRIKELTQGFPYTDKQVPRFDFIDVNNQQKIPIYFNLLIYGNPNDVDEELYEVIKEEILANSKYPEEEWEKHLPDLFNPLEFTAVPYWNTMGLINETKRGSSYSPIGDYESLLTLPQYYCPQVNPTDLIKSLQTVPFLFESTLVGFVAKPNNYGGKTKIKDIYPNYQLISVNDVDNGLMGIKLSRFIREMESLLSAGQVVEPNGIPPVGIKRVTRGGKLYVAKRIDTVNYLVPTYYQMIKDGFIDE